MGYDTEAAGRVRQFLAGRGDVTEKRMVGGLSFLVGGHLCCGITGEALMIRVGPAERERALARPHVKPLVLGSRSPAGFVCVDPPGYLSDAALGEWVKLGIDFVRGLPPKQAGAGRAASLRSGR